jgi:pyruvate carboxylase
MGGPQRLPAAKPGKVDAVLEPGDSPQARGPVAVTGAMKMENDLRASRDGRVTGIAVRDGQPVDAGVLLAVIADG